MHVLERRAAPVQGWGESSQGRKRWRRPCNYFFSSSFPRAKIRESGGKGWRKKENRGKGPLSPFFAAAAAASPQGAARQKERRDTSKKKGGGRA